MKIESLKLDIHITLTVDGVARELRILAEKKEDIASAFMWAERVSRTTIAYIEEDSPLLTQHLKVSK